MPKNESTLVYSTEVGRIEAEASPLTPPASDGFAKIRRETKGRKGKGVLVISGLGLETKDLKVLAKKIKTTCGSGGSVVDFTIEIQGDKRDVVKGVLEKQGFKVKFVGG